MRSRTTTQLIFLQSLVCDVDVTQQLSAGFVLLRSLCSAWSRECTKNLRFNPLMWGRRIAEALEYICLPLYSALPIFLQWVSALPLSFQEVQPIPGLRSRAEGGKEVVGNRDGDRGGSQRSWRAGAVLRLLQPRLHVSAAHLQISLASSDDLISLRCC